MSRREERQARDARAEHERWLAEAAQISDEEFAARVRAWDAENPEVIAQMTPKQLGH
jgi:hypothetical protein